MREMRLNAFTQCCINHHSEGQWKNPLDGTSRGYRDLGYWVKLAELLERGCFDALFLADVHGTYDVYSGSREAAVRHAVQFPGNDPTLVISAMAHATRHLGFACTFSTTYFPPYHTAKVFSTLDHLTGGRIGWNVVTSYLADANANFGIAETLEHDQRYDRADEYMEVVYKLWEHSWEETAIVRDSAGDTHTDPSRVHAIDHVGQWFSVPGPHMCEPSPQRTPLIFQAGQSGRGIRFAARHAEAVFCVYPNLQTCRAGAQALRDAAEAEGRGRDGIRICQGITVFVAPTAAEARAKLAECQRYASPEGSLALLCGWAGVDVSQVTRDRPLESFESNAIRGVLSYFKLVDPAREWTLTDIAEFMAVGSIMPKIVGTPREVADTLEQWLEDGDLDGFNLVPAVQPAGFEDFVSLVVPELQRRGRMRQHYDTATLREHYFGRGRARLPASHVAHRSLPPGKQSGR
jgi:FMN-dependent oxidoreductase (nitrilotriacetate monooxygenase family)